MFIWLERVTSQLVFEILQLDPASRIGSALHFFVYDVIKIIILLVLMIFLISYIRSYLQSEKIRDILSGQKGVRGNIAASLLGVVSPFCSCSTVPVFIGFVEAGVPLGVTFSFLITSPLINEAALAVLIATFGIRIGLIYTITGIIIGVVGGKLIGLLKLEYLVEEYVYSMKVGKVRTGTRNQKQRLVFAKEETIQIVKKVGPFVLIGVAIGAVAHGWIPEGALLKYAGPDNPFAVIAAVLMGIPMYSSTMATIPAVEALIGKGMGFGTALAFMMAITALSLPELIILKKVIKPRLIAYFVGIVSFSIIIVGYGFNLFL